MNESDNWPLEVAKQVAEKANECCYRSDGFEEAIRDFCLKLILEHLK